MSLLDEFGNYQASFTVPVATPLPPDVSEDWELLWAEIVCGVGPPTHTPRRAAQDYTDNTDGTRYTFWDGEWHPTP